jgi:hypothetical protein
MFNVYIDEKIRTLTFVEIPENKKLEGKTKQNGEHICIQNIHRVEKCKSTTSSGDGKIHAHPVDVTPPPPPPLTTTSSNSQGANNFLLTVPKSWYLQLEPGKCIANEKSDTKNFSQKHKGVGWTNCLVNCKRYLYNGHNMYIKGTDVARVHVAI